LISITFCLFGFILGVWADGFERLQVVPSMIVMPLTFLGGSFSGVSDVNAAFSLGMIVLFMLICLSVIWWIFKTGYKIKL
jgi:ABC-2 type transport system permease protein